MRLIKSIVFILSVGWPIFFIIFGLRASLMEILILFIGLISIAYVLSWDERRS